MPRYKVLAPGVIRTGAAKDSPKADPDKLTVGQEIDVSETQEVDGTTRLRFEGGWTSLTAKSGKVLLELLEESEDEVTDSEPEDSDLDSEPEASDLDSEPEASDLDSEPEASDLDSEPDDHPPDNRASW